MLFCVDKIFVVSCVEEKNKDSILEEALPRET